MNSLNKLSVLFFLLLAGVLTSCSSGPKETDIVNSRKNRAAELTDFGNKYYNDGKYEQSLVFFNLSLEENIASDFEPGIIKSNNSIGKVYLNLNDTETAEKYFLAAYDLSEKIKDKNLIIVSSNNLGELYLQTEDFRKAEKMLDKAFAAADSGSEESAVILHNLGISYKKQDDFDKALSRFNQAVKINIALKEHSRLAANYYMIASIYSKREDYNQAESFLLKALDEDKIIENSYGIGKDFKAIGIVLEKKGDTEAAYSYFMKSYMVFDVLKSRNDTVEVLEKLKNLAAELKREKDAAFFSARLDSLINRS